MYPQAICTNQFGELLESPGDVTSAELRLRIDHPKRPLEQKLMQFG